MDKLEAVLTSLWEQVPRCSNCASDCFASQTYVTFTCLHFLCLKCANQGVSYAFCARCPIAQPISLDSESLVQQQRTLSYNLDLFFNQKKADSFSAACAAFYNLLSYMSTGTPITVPPNASGGENQQYPIQSPPMPSLHQPAPSNGSQQHQNLLNSEDPSISGTPVPWACPRCQTGEMYPASQTGCKKCTYINLKTVDTLRVEIWTCGSCGATIEKGKTCPCERPEVYVKSKSVPINHQPDVLPSQNQMVWTCLNCKYEYNPRNEPSCTMCQYRNPQLEEVKTEKVRSSGSAWQCKLCDYPSNFRLDICSKCNAPRTPLEPALRSQQVHQHPAPQVVQKQPAQVQAPNRNPNPSAPDQDKKPPEYSTWSRSQKKKWRNARKK